MELILFSFFVGLSLIAVVIGLWKPEHTEFSMAGFLFLFMLSFVLINENLLYHTGQTELVDYGFNESGILMNETHTFTDVYSTYTGTEGSFNSSFVGYWMAIASGLGFAFILYSLGKARGYFG